jgi:hypothetical protein
MAGSSGNRGKKRKASRRWCSLGMTWAVMMIMTVGMSTNHEPRHTGVGW